MSIYNKPSSNDFSESINYSYSGTQTPENAENSMNRFKGFIAGFSDDENNARTKVTFNPPLVTDNSTQANTSVEYRFSAFINASSNAKGKIFRAIIGFIFTSIFLFVIAYLLKDLDKEYLLSSINMLNIFNLENNVFPVLMSGFAAALAVGLNEYNRRPTQPLKWYITLAIVAIFYLVIFSLTFLELENLNPSTILTIFFTNIALLILGANISK